MLIALEVLLGVVVLASAVFYACCAFVIQRHFVRKADTNSAPLLPASILIPVCGLEDGASKKWASFCRQDHPEYEVLFGVRDPDDPAVPILQELEQQFPDRVRVVIRPEVLGANYQISNLIHQFREARYPAIVLTDSDMRAEPDYLRTVVGPLGDPKVGLVTCGYANNHPRSLGAGLATLGRCIDFIPHVLLACWRDGRMRFALGATLATRREVLEKIGGLESVVDRIGSDYHIGKRISDAGYEVRLSQYVIENDAGPEPVHQVYDRELRWARTSRINRGPEYYGLVISHGALYALPLLALAPTQPWVWGVVALSWGLRLTQIITAIPCLKARGLCRVLWMMPLRELLSFAVFHHSILGDDVKWRGRRLRLNPDGILEELPGRSSS
jgi:ceramide glucosyltransferase